MARDLRFAWFGPTFSKSWLNFLSLLRAGHGDCVVNAAALDYIRKRSLSGAAIALLAEHGSKRFADEDAWMAHLERHGITALKARFDLIFRRKTGFATLDRALARLYANKAELLVALDRPDIPLHTNGSENDIRCQVTRRKISGGTRSDAGRDARNAFLCLMKTCDKLGVSFWDYLGSRLMAESAPVIAPLPNIVRQRASQA